MDSLGVGPHGRGSGDGGRRTIGNPLSGRFSPGGDSSGAGPKWLVSVNGGRFPHWSGDGRQLALLDRETLHVVDVATAPVSRAGERQAFAPASPTLAGAVPPDLKRLLLAIPIANSSAPVLNVLLYWPSALK